MIYPWMCLKCEQVTDAERRLADMDQPPACCDTCGHPELKRIVVRPKGLKGYILEGGGWHHNSYTKYRSIK